MSEWPMNEYEEPKMPGRRQRFPHSPMIDGSVSGGALRAFLSARVDRCAVTNFDDCRTSARGRY